MSEAPVDIANFRARAHELAAQRKARWRVKAEAKAADGFVRGDARQILKGHPENIRRAVQQLGVVLRLNQFSTLQASTATARN
jgi:hypothetical protein